MNPISTSELDGADLIALSSGTQNGDNNIDVRFIRAIFRRVDFFGLGLGAV
jgi:hypothetical protein